MATSAQKTNWFAVWTSIGVVIALLIVGWFVISSNQQSTDSTAPTGAVIDSDTGAITIGEGPDDVAVWFDFYCPHCQDFEDVYGPTLAGLVDDGAIALHLYPVALSGLNAASGTEFSERSAGALYCVASDAPEATSPFFTQLFAQKPSGPGLTDQELSSLAAEAGADDAVDCIANGTHRQFAVDQAAALPASPEGGAGTPTLLVNGEYVTITGDVEADIVTRLQG